MRTRMKSCAALLLLATSTFSCVTPMSSEKVSDYTTCRGKSIEVIQKNLLLAGYTIASKNSETLVTEFKQVGAYGTDKEFLRYSVVMVEPSIAKFKAQVRKDGIKTVDTYSESASKGYSEGYNDVSVQGKTETSRTQNLVQNSDMMDVSYYDEYEARYSAMRNEVCGN